MAAMEPAASRSSRLVVVVAETTALFILAAHGGHGAVTPPPRAVVALGAPVRAFVTTAGGGSPAAAFATVRPWVARLQALHDLSMTTTSLDVVVDGEQPQQEGRFPDCWGAIMGLSSCYSEILLFFVNDESYIGPECCVAIRGATLYCWPAMLASVGFTAEEADVLRGFFDGEDAAQHHQLATHRPCRLPDGEPGGCNSSV